MDQMILTHENEVFTNAWKDFDEMLVRMFGSMVMRGAEEADLTMKFHFKLEKKNAFVNGSNREIVQPSFKHDISSVMQVKDKASGTFKGNVELTFDSDGKPIVRDIDDGQTSMWDDNHFVNIEQNDVVDAEVRSLASGKHALLESAEKNTADEESPFAWMMQFRDQTLHIEENAGYYLVLSPDKKVILSSASDKDSPFYIDPWKLQKHIGHTISCVASPETAEDPDAIEIWCDDCGEYLFGINNPAHETEDSPSDEDYQYDEPEDEN